MPDYDFKNRLKLVEFLKKYTDKDHPLSQFQLRKIDGADEIMGYKNSFTRRLFEMAEAYNTDAQGKLLDTKEWKIVYPGYLKRRNGEENQGARNGKIYYNHSISKKELDFLIAQIRKTDNFTKEEKINLENKLLSELASIHYKPTNYGTMPEKFINLFSTTNNPYVEKNLQILRDAIDNEYMISFNMMKMNEFGEMVFSKEESYLISPYLIIDYKGYYWLLGNCQRERIYGEEYKYKFSSGVSIYRIDKIGNVYIATKNSTSWQPKKCRFPYKTKDKIKRWHEYASFLHNEEIAPGGDLENIPEFSFKILWDKFPKKDRHDYTFIYDTFGKNFGQKKNVVYVRSSMSFFEKWVIQYADKILLTEDTEESQILKEKIKRKII